LAVREELVQHAPYVRGHRNDLAASCVNLAVLRWKAGRLPEAAEYARRALGLWEQLAREAPREPFYRQWQAKCCEILSAVGPADQREEGERLACRSVELHKGLTNEFPGVPMHRHDLAAGWNRLGIHLARGKRFADAAAAFREALAVLDRLAEEFPGRAGYRGNAGDTLVNLALTARDLGDAAEARRLWERAAGEFRAALDLDPSSQEYRDKLRREFGPPAEPPVVPPDG
jgi:tetratricopeptide (TPR) repeat protein